MLAMLVCLASAVALGAGVNPGAPAAAAASPVAKKVLGAGQLGEDLLRPDAWGPYVTGFERQDGALSCDNGQDASARRGAAQSVVLNQTRPLPIVAAAWSKAQGVSGTPDADYSLYLDLIYTDGTPLWGQAVAFGVGSHDWERREVVVLPAKPVKSLTAYLLLRGHAGRAWFRDVELRQARPEAGAVMLDGLPVIVQGPAVQGFQVRDVAAGGDYVRLEREALGLRLESKESAQDGATFFDVTLSDTTGKDRAVTLLYAVPLEAAGLRWLEDPRRSAAVEPGGEYMRCSRFSAGANGRL